MHTLWERKQGTYELFVAPYMDLVFVCGYLQKLCFSKQNYVLQTSLRCRHPCQLISYTYRVPGYTVKAFAYTVGRKQGTYQLFVAPYMDLVFFPWIKIIFFKTKLCTTNITILQTSMPAYFLHCGKEIGDLGFICCNLHGFGFCPWITTKITFFKTKLYAYYKYHYVVDIHYPCQLISYT